MDRALILHPRIFEPIGWLAAGMTTRFWPAGAPNDRRQAMVARLRDELGLPNAKIILAEQVHGCDVARVDQNSTQGDQDLLKARPPFPEVLGPCSTLRIGKPCFPSSSAGMAGGKQSASMAGGKQSASMACALPNETSTNSLPEDEAREIPGVDALATASPLVLIGVFTADCLPVALVDPRGRNLAVAHAGREGTRQGIVRKTVECLREMGSAPRDMAAWVGPSICAAHYEVSEEIAAEFRERFGDKTGAVTGSEGRHLDLKEIVRRELMECGVDPSRIEVDPRCTLENADLFYSYRREGASAGRMFTFLGIRDAE